MWNVRDWLYHLLCGWLWMLQQFTIHTLSQNKHTVLQLTRVLIVFIKFTVQTLNAQLSERFTDHQRVGKFPSLTNNYIQQCKISSTNDKRVARGAWYSTSYIVHLENNDLLDFVCILHSRQSLASIVLLWQMSHVVQFGDTESQNDTEKQM